MNAKKVIPIRRISSADVRTPDNEEVAYLYTQPDNTQWLRFSDWTDVALGWAGWAAERITYGKIQLADAWITEVLAWIFPRRNVLSSNPYFFERDTSWALDLQILNTNFTWCFVDIFEYNGWTLISSWVKQRFATRSDIYTFLSTRAMTSWGVYTNDIIAVVYDEIDNTIPAISRFYSNNRLYSSIKWRQHYLSWWFVSNRLSPWQSYNPFITWMVQDIIRNMTTATTYNYNSADTPENVIWFPSNRKLMYGWLPVGGKVKGGLLRKAVVWAAVVASPSWEYSYDAAWSSYLVYWLIPSSSFNWCSSSQWDDIKQFVIWWDFSVCYAAKLVNWACQSVQLRPLWIDQVFLDYIDPTKYELYAMYSMKNTSPRIKKIDLGPLSQDLNKGDVTRVTKWIWLEQNKISTGKVWFKNAIRQMPDVRFFKRDIATGKISKITNQRITTIRHRNSPMMYIVK